MQGQSQEAMNAPWLSRHLASVVLWQRMSISPLAAEATSFDEGNAWPDSQPRYQAQSPMQRCSASRSRCFIGVADVSQSKPTILLAALLANFDETRRLSKPWKSVNFTSPLPILAMSHMKSHSPVNWLSEIRVVSEREPNDYSLTLLHWQCQYGILDLKCNPGGGRERELKRCLFVRRMGRLGCLGRCSILRLICLEASSGAAERSTWECFGRIHSTKAGIFCSLITSLAAFRVWWDWLVTMELDEPISISRYDPMWPVRFDIVFRFQFAGQTSRCR